MELVDAEIHPRQDYGAVDNPWFRMWVVVAYLPPQGASATSGSVDNYFFQGQRGRGIDNSSTVGGGGCRYDSEKLFAPYRQASRGWSGLMAGHLVEKGLRNVILVLSFRSNHKSIYRTSKADNHRRELWARANDYVYEGALYKL